MVSRDHQYFDGGRHSHRSDGARTRRYYVRSRDATGTRPRARPILVAAGSHRPRVRRALPTAPPPDLIVEQVSNLRADFQAALRWFVRLDLACDHCLALQNRLNATRDHSVLRCM